MAKNWEHAAGLLWPVLTSAATNGITLYYQDLAPIIGTNDQNVGRGLGPILYYCVNCKLPPLTSIVINKQKRLPGQGFNAWNIDYIDDAHREVYQFNWLALANPFEGFCEDDTTEIFAIDLFENPDKSGEIYAKVKVRVSRRLSFVKHCY